MLTGRELIKSEASKVIGTAFPRYNKHFVCDFSIKESSQGIGLIFGGDNWWASYWFMRYEGGIEPIIQHLKKLSWNGKYYITGGMLYSDKSHEKTTGAEITLFC